MSKFRPEEYAIDHTEQILSRLFNLALNRFSWEGLPEGMNSRKIEENLIRYGQVMFFEDKNYGLLCLPCYGTNSMNVYNEPVYYNVFGNGYQKIVHVDDGIIIRNNALATNDYDDLLTFATRINEVELTQDINLNGQKTPYIIMCDEKERLTIKNILLQVRKFKYAILGSKSLKLNNTDVLNIKSDYLLDKLQLQKTELMNEALTFLGINNANVEKKERMLVDEVNANNDFILVNLDHMFDEREQACKLINEKFGKNIKVEKRQVQFNKEVSRETSAEGV